MNILENMSIVKPKKKLALKRRILIIAATFVCFTLIVSAAYLVPKYDFLYVEISGSFIDLDGNVTSIEIELDQLYVTPGVLNLNENTKVDSAMRTKFGGMLRENPGQLRVILTGVSDQDIKIITKEHGEFEPDDILQLDGSDYQYLFIDFPEINEFILVNGDDSVEVVLEQLNSGDDFNSSEFELSDHDK